MSGLCGVVSSSPEALADGILAGMLRSMAHRGQAGSERFCDPVAGVALGQVHLRAFPSDPASKETGFGRSGALAVALDGTLTRRPAGVHVAAARAGAGTLDVRTALAAYASANVGGLAELEGPFTLALWDGERGRVVLTRDRLGEKALYYCVTDDGKTLVFASEIKALLEHPTVRAELDQDSLALYFAFGYIPGPRTLFRGISKLLPGERLTCQPGRAPSRAKYWTLPAIRDGIADEAFCTQRLRELFLEGLKGYVNGAREVAVFLSGGLDSSIIVAGLRELGVPRIGTFTIGFDVDPANSRIREDLRYARLVSKAYSTEHHEVIVGPDHDPSSGVVRVIGQFDDLIMTPNIYSKHLLAQAVHRAGFDSVVTGSAAAGACGVHRKFLDPKKREKLLEKTRACATDAERYYTLRSGLIDLDQQDGLFVDQPSLGKQDVLDALAEYIDDIHSDDFFRLFLFSNLMITCPEKTLRVLDRSAIMTSVEARSPYLDRKLVEFSTQIPPSFDGGRTYASLKTHMKKAFEADLPLPVLERTVQGYPSYYWSRGELGPAHDRLVSRESIEEAGVFRYDAVARLLGAEQADDEDSDSKSKGKLAWALKQFSLWHRIHILQAPEATAV